MKGFRTSCSFSSPELSLSQGSSTPRDPFAGPQAVLAYLSRYTHRVAISNSPPHRGSTTPASPSAGRTIAPATGRAAWIKPMTLHAARVHPPLSPARAARAASTASATTGSSPTPTAPPPSIACETSSRQATGRLSFSPTNLDLDPVRMSASSRAANEAMALGAARACRRALGQRRAEGVVGGGTNCANS